VEDLVVHQLNLRRVLLLSRSVPIAEDRHEVEVFLDQLRADGLPVDDAHNENWVSERDRAALDSLLSRWPSRRLAASTGRSRNTLRCWFCRARFQLRKNLEHKERPLAGQSASPPH
jgi:hypothetical protein